MIAGDHFETYHEEESELTIEWDEVLRLYRAMLRETGGEFGFVSEGTLRFILDAVNTMRGDIFAKAAYAIHEVATKHPLVNGNKRLALSLGDLMLNTEGYEPAVDVTETVNFMLKVAKGELSKKMVEAWLRSKYRKKTL